MKAKMNFKKILTSIGLLALVVPTTLSVVACGGITKVREDKLELSKIIKETNLNELPNKEKTTILEAVEAKNPAAKGKIDIKDNSITDTLAVIVPVDESVYTGQVTVTFTIPEVPNLGTIVTETNLGELTDNKVRTILQAVEAKNPNAKGKIEIEEGSITGTEAIIIPNTDEYSGFVKVKFTAESVLSDLSEIVIIKYLDELINNQEKTILDKVVELNLEAANKIRVEKDSITDTQAKIIPSTDEYTGFVTVKFWFISEVPYLKELVKETKLGSLQDNQEKTILDKVVELNLEAANKIRVESVDQDHNIALIAAINPNEYKGLVQVNFILGELTEQDVVNAINVSLYYKVILVDTKVEDLSKLIDSDFIKQNILNKEIKAFFNDELFDLNSIMKDELNDLTDEDLKNQNSRLATTINYNYGAIKNQSANLSIEIKESILPISKERGSSLQRIKDTKSGTDERWIAWILYFARLYVDFNQIVWDFTNEELNNDKVIQSILYERVKWIIWFDFQSYDISDEYNFSTIKFDIQEFKVIQEEKEIIAYGDLYLDVLHGDKYFTMQVRFHGKFYYNVII